MADLLPQEEHTRLVVRLRSLVPGANVAQCKSCGAPVWWGCFVSGRSAPVDVEPVEGGNIRATGAMRVVHGTEVPEIGVTSQASLLDEPRFVSHFGTCPHADEHRKGR